MDKIDEIVKNIKAWNMENIDDLKNMIDELDAAVNEINNLNSGFAGCKSSEFVDFTSLPSVEIPAHTDYPIWAMDKHGKCLVGIDFATESYVEIDQWYTEK